MSLEQQGASPPPIRACPASACGGRSPSSATPAGTPPSQTSLREARPPSRAGSAPARTCRPCCAAKSPTAAAPICSFNSSTPEDQLHMVGTAEIEFLAHDVLQEEPPLDGPVEHLGGSELRL